ncbi:aldolase/citrate lyase family protein [Rhizorhabdus sp.]|jgi:2-keto-3-deoxy-L-rhamnonate aldolase RhmA|uniref:HpcH/HpaI aldolase family protein n=1 Tax=Rhizorhabdus sp. TaxID=1968843 RepID=UPI0019B8C0F5|nr:aldolase/citrate lyase family protein [Rhizorhabdus sp.]MBD3760410.1 aldolase [Rhizorhabdus sp.]
MQTSFRDSIRSGRPLVGTFIKTGTSETSELLGHAGLDFAIADAEHAPLGLERIDRVVLGARSAGLPCLVRVPALAPALVGQMLDLGAAGVVIPHVRDADIAREAIEEARYVGGRRGFSPSTRAGDYGLHDPSGHIARADAAVTVWCQIEDASALNHLDAIAAVQGVDVLFIGRADLAHSLGCGARDGRLDEAVRAIATAGRRHGRAIAIFVGSMEEAPTLASLGITIFACGSDQSHLATAARAMRRACDELLL